MTLIRRLIPTGLRARLVVTFTAVALVTSALVASIGFVLSRGALLARTERIAVNDTRMGLTRSSPPVVTTRDEMFRVAQALTEPGRTVVVTHGSAEVTGRAGNGGPRAADAPAALREVAQSRLAVQRRSILGEPTLIVATQVHRRTANGLLEPTGLHVYVFVSLDEEERILYRLGLALWQASAITLVLAVGVALLSARRVLRPVRRLGTAARALGDGRLDTRLPVHGRDELAGLTATFNQTAHALERTVSELRALEASHRRFVADVSHELRTPLTAMTAVADVLSEDAARLPDDAGAAVRLVVTETERLRVLVEHLIEISRLDSGTAQLSCEEVSVSEALADCLEVRGWTAGVTVSVDEDLSIAADPRRFDVIVANLVGNALRHGAPPVSVTARGAVRHGRSGLEIEVRDHGPGIPPDATRRVFDRFYKATPPSNGEGSGLGLAIAFANAELHGGTITATNVAPQGALFTTWLPDQPREECS